MAVTAPTDAPGLPEGTAGPDPAHPAPPAGIVPAPAVGTTPGLPPAAERLDPPFPQERWWWSWGGPLAVTVIAAVLRLVDLGRPNAVVFDETYYAKDAQSLLQFGYERQAVPGADARMLAGNPDLFTDQPSFVVHPPIGKWVIAVGEKYVGLSPTGWRIATAVLGVLTVLLLARTVRRMTRSTLLGTLAGLLLALDGVSVAVSRTALLDGPLTFFVVAAFAALVLDRDHARARLATWVRQRPPGVPAPAGPGPGLGLRPLRVLAGVLLGLACATKWSGLWFLVSFGLMTVLWDRGARRLAGVRTPTWATVRSDVMPAFLSLVPVAVAVYLVSWTGWFRSEGGYDRLWYQSNPATSGWTWVPGPLRSLWHYHAEMLQFHRTLETPHSYQAHPAGWTVLVRPTAFWSQTFQPGQDGCVVRQGSTCIREVTALGPPVLWWAATLALAWLVYQWAVQRDWRAGAALNGVAAGWLPWLLLFSERTIFAFYAVVFSPFLVMGLTLALGAVLGPADAPGSRRTWGAAAVGAFVLLLVANAAWLFPLWSGVLLPYDDWYARLWFRGWI